MEREIKYEYNDEGLLVKKIENNKYISNIKYSDNNKIETWCDPIDLLIKKIIYDDNGNKIEEADFDISKYVYEYDNKNRLIKSTWYNRDGIEGYHYNITYDEDKNTKTEIYSDDTHVYHYNDKNRIEIIEIFKNIEPFGKTEDLPYSIITYRYKDFGDMYVAFITEKNIYKDDYIEIIKYKKFPNTKDFYPIKYMNLNGIDRSFEYKFDDNGNKIYEKEIVNN